MSKKLIFGTVVPMWEQEGNLHDFLDESRCDHVTLRNFCEFHHIVGILVTAFLKIYKSK